MESFVVIGTDTGVGKTAVCSFFARYLIENNQSVITQKWLQSGSLAYSEDISAHDELINVGRGFSGVDYSGFDDKRCSYCFRQPVTPYLAAKLENVVIDGEKIKDDFRFLEKHFSVVVVEGSGGALVQYQAKKYIVDLVKDLNLGVVLVADNKLGAINHVLLTIEALEARGIKIMGLIFNQVSVGVDSAVIKTNTELVLEAKKIRILADLPFNKNLEELYQFFKREINKISFI
jgi:dethiobiotin synthase